MANEEQMAGRRVPPMKHYRRRHVALMRAWLLRCGAPRTHMAFIVLLTGCVGFMSSALLLALGLHIMWLRYLLAIVIAYGCFMFLVWLWILTTRHKDRTGTGDILSESIRNLDVPLPDAPDPGMGGGDGSIFEALGLTVDDAVVIMVMVLVAIGSLFVSVYLVYMAPTFFAEALVDAALSAALYRRTRQAQPVSWARTVFRRTWFPVLITAMLFLVLGLVLHAYLPQADSIGDVLREIF